VKSWNPPEVPSLPGRGALPRVFDTSTASLVQATPDAVAGLYVCGITPYDATHIGHAATYLAFDTLIRLWIDAGIGVSYVQNVTDVDDPLLERATATGVDWRELATQQIDLFRSDMRALGIIPPDHFVAVTDMIAPVARAVRRLLDDGLAYRLGVDVYFDCSAAAAASPWHLGQESGLDRESMLGLAAERGGDPQREGKRDPLDPMLWMGARPGEPSWPSGLGDGRPGWHIECSVIAQELLDVPLTVAGGGRDLVFPHHEFTSAHTAALTGREHALAHVHAGLVGYRGEKMSKSLGNLVFVSALAAEGADPRAIRLAILDHHYREDWEWAEPMLVAAESRLATWRRWASAVSDGGGILTPMRDALSDDLDTPAALAVVDARIAAGIAPTEVDLAAIHALLGVSLR
jgi:L-cysteine:1D-myo-inositol 2-amino-2-deoxy-alpha-D-glucopyranoside ligase